MTNRFPNNQPPPRYTHPIVLLRFIPCLVASCFIASCAPSVSMGPREPRLDTTSEKSIVAAVQFVLEHDDVASMAMKSAKANFGDWAKTYIAIIGVHLVAGAPVEGKLSSLLSDFSVPSVVVIAVSDKTIGVAANLEIASTLMPDNSIALDDPVSWPDSGVVHVAQLGLDDLDAVDAAGARLLVNTLDAEPRSESLQDQLSFDGAFVWAIRREARGAEPEWAVAVNPLLRVVPADVPRSMPVNMEMQIDAANRLVHAVLFARSGMREPAIALLRVSD